MAPGKCLVVAFALFVFEKGFLFLSHWGQGDEIGLMMTFLAKRPIWPAVERKERLITTS